MGKRKVQKKYKKCSPKFNISSFNENDYYLFNVTRYRYIISNIKNLNDIKAKDEDIKIIKDEINLCNSFKEVKSELNVIKILPEYFKVIKNMTKTDLKHTEYAKKIQYIINDLKKNKIAITLKQISKKYKEIYDKSISITTVSRILKKHLNIRHLKTSIKNPKLHDNDYMIMTFVFIRGFLRSMILKLNMIFVDETNFLLENKNLYLWRNPEEKIIAGGKNNIKERLNLILGVSKDKIIHKKFVRGSVDSKIFLEFLTEMINSFEEEEKNNIIIIMDNARFHTTKEIISFFKDNKLKGLTICPYRSYLNMIELVFRYIKNITYKNVYNKLVDLKNDVIKILESNQLEKSLSSLYKETLEQILLFIQNNNHINIQKMLKEIEE